MLAHIARGKLSKEAAKPDHDLHRLVGHANMLDSLMLDLSNAEQEQEAWFNHTVSNVSKPQEQPRRVQWADTIPEEVVDEEEEQEQDSDSDSSDDEEEYEIAREMPVRRISAKTPAPTDVEMQDEDEDEDEDDEMEDDDDYEDSLALTRTSSAHQPPELMHEDSDSESDDDSMPPSPPPAAPLNFNALSEKQRQAIATTSLYQSDKTISRSDEEESFFDQGVQTAIAAY